MSQQLKVLATKSDDLSLNFQIHMVEKENGISKMAVL